ncbi:MAG TPA: hypothetical protein VNM24_06555 [Burkholderiales bacterium]|nr:hypothetical protein [Burkholderiales bacterium]
MNSIAIYFQHAELALAAYSNLAPGMILDDYEAALRDGGRGMSPTQAQRFAQRWRVAAPQINDVSGLSATVFEEVLTGKRYLAIRGTTLLDLSDITADLGILLHGIPGLSSQYRALYEQVLRWTLDGTLPGRFTVSGHSLGGWLAAGLVSDLGAPIEHAYLFNAPGVLGVTETVPALARALGIDAWSGDPAKASNLRAAAGASPIAGLGLAVSAPIGIEIEAASFFDFRQGNHSIVRLNDALAVQAVYAGLDAALSLEQTGWLLRAASGQNALTLEAALDAIRLALLGEGAVGASPSTEGDRERLYGNLYGLADSAAYRALAGALRLRPLTQPDAQALAAQAGADFGSFLALRYLLPFVLEGAGGVLADAHADLYARWSADRARRVAGAADLEFTDSYLADRAAFLAALSEANVMDAGGVVIPAQPDNWRYVDLTQKVEVIAFGQAPASMRRWAVFGGESSDVVGGDDQADRLYGGRGSDLLTGGRGDDYLEAGAGMDVYQYTAATSLLGTPSNDGADAIRDTDGRGLIRYSYRQAGLISDAVSSRVIAGLGLKVSADEWRSPDGKFVYARQFSGLQLSIRGDAGGSIRILDFDYGKAAQEGYLGIRLLDAPGDPQTATTILGDLQPVDFDPDTPGVQTQTDVLGNVITDPNAPAPEREDVLYDSASSDLMVGACGTTRVGEPRSSGIATLGARALLMLAVLSFGVVAQEPPSPAPLPVEQMRAVAYTKEFARRFRLPEPTPGSEPSGGLQAIEFFVEKGPPWASEFYYCIFKLYVDSNLPIAFPQPGTAGSKWLLVYAKHFFLWPDPDNRRWLSFSEADRKHHADRQSAYDRLAAIATPDFEFLARGAYEDIGFDEYYRELFPGLSYVQLSTGCFSERKLSRRPEWQLWLKKEGGRDYRRQLRIHPEDFLKFTIPRQLLARVVEFSAQADRYNAVVREHEYKLQRERAARSGAQTK